MTTRELYRRLIRCFELHFMNNRQQRLTLRKRWRAVMTRTGRIDPFWFHNDTR